MTSTLVRAQQAGSPDPARELRRRLLVSVALAVPVVALSAVPALRFTGSPWLALALAGVVAGWGGLPVHRGALAGLRRGTGTADALVSVAVLATLCWSFAALVLGGAPAYPEVAAVLTVLGLAGRLAEARTGRRLTDRVATVLSAVGLGAALATLGLWLGLGAPWRAAFAAALAVLVAACPCALVMAAPAALLAATRPGLSAATLERLALVDTVLLAESTVVEPDSLALHSVHTAGGVTRETAVRLAGAVGQAATDPLGRAVAAAAGDPLPGAAEFDETGDGARGIVAEVVSRDSVATVVAHAVLAGRPELLAAHGIALPPGLAAAWADAEATGRAAVAVAWDGVPRAVLALGAAVHPAAVDAVRGLRALGVVPVLAGDNPAVAGWVGIAPDAVLAGRGAIRRLRDAGRTVAVVGAGGIAPGTAAGTFGLARRTAAVIRGNVVLAGTAVAALPFAAAGALDAALAAAVVVGASAAVLANALRLHRIPVPARKVLLRTRSGARTEGTA